LLFSVNDRELLDDRTDNILCQEVFREGQYVELSNELHEMARVLLEEVPIQLTENSNQVFGCPDCADQGGLHLRIRDGGTDRNFRFDLQNSENPEHLRSYLRKVNQVVDGLTEQ
jgi:hypothetical protein